jgi:amino acid adenylation domain-containing protein/thioester reductase-like protein
MLPTLVRAHAKTHPERVAVVVGQERITYGELDAKMSALVRLLRDQCADRELIGIHLARSPEAIVALLAVWGVGAAYTLVEPTAPVAEGVNRLAASGVGLVLTSQEYQDEFGRRGVRGLDVRGLDVRGQSRCPAAPLTPVRDADTAYVLYTSGSTGTPKGVMISRGNIRHYTESLLVRLQITEPLRYAHATTLAADLGNTCLFLALWTGGTLHLVEDVTRRDPSGLLRYLRDERIDVLKTTPSHWRAVLQSRDRDVAAGVDLRFLILGGELLPVSLARQTLGSGVTRRLVNHYGPTETTVGVAAYVLGAESELDNIGDSMSVPVGTALGATRLFVRTRDADFKERDATGELYVTGPSLGLGYRSDAEASAAAFTNDLDAVMPGVGRAYRTGDMVRADSRGILEFLGRSDRQVKISGYRVELGHVETGLRRLPGVGDAVAFHRPDRRPVLVAAVATTDRSPDDLRRELREGLPSYLIPGHIETFDAFPCTSNGKTDRDALHQAVEERLARRASQASVSTGAFDSVLTDVHAAWRQVLGHDGFGIDEDFTAAGGSSIDAIHATAILQSWGYEVSAAAFMAQPTVAALASRLRERGTADAAPPVSATMPAADPTALSPAQRWFFRQRFPQANQWNQALLLDVSSGVRTEELAAAVRDVVGMHPMLRTAFRDGSGGVRREAVVAHGMFTCSVLPDGDEAAAQHIRDVATARQEEISFATGRVFKAHLFQGHTRAHLLLVCHHLCIDAVSWRIVVTDLSRCYSERLRGLDPAAPPMAVDFGTWAAKLREHADELGRDLVHWDDLARDPAVPTWPDGDPDGGNREGDARAVWFGMSRQETDALTRAAAERAETAPHTMLLAAFAQSLSSLLGTEDVIIDIESHGRVMFDDALDVSRVVGWFTSTFPIRIGVVHHDLAATSKAVAAALADVPHLGIGYALHDQARRADVCFNYLASFPLPDSDDLRLSVSTHSVGPMRGADNGRGYGLKLTARIHDGQLIADLSFTPRLHDSELVLAVCRATRAHLLKAIGTSSRTGKFIVEHESSTGVLTRVPRALRDESPARPTREYSDVLVTGATGFIGAHMLHLLLNHTTARVVCLVRERDGRSAMDRLREAYAWYLPGERLDLYGGRLSVLGADLSESDFGLPSETYNQLSRTVNAIYHLAGDPRLFGEHEFFERHNTRAVRGLVGFAMCGRPKDLHHVSTLAVCGSGPESDRVIFSESSFNIGQRFLNEYERSKYEAERVIHEFVIRGGTGFIYRIGNVTGHSVSGRFQRNAGDNWLVQMLQACVLIGRVPRADGETLPLSPVDVVAEGILAISCCARIAGGTFHVETDHTVSYQEIFAAAREAGCVLEDDEAQSFTALLERYLEEGNERISLAHFWASRPERNVRFDHSHTQRTLAGLGVQFPSLDHAWLTRYFRGLVRQGVISHAGKG